jgi:hypothetical protein
MNEKNNYIKKYLLHIFSRSFWFLSTFTIFFFLFPIIARLVLERERETRPLWSASTESTIQVYKKKSLGQRDSVETAQILNIINLNL